MPWWSWVVSGWVLVSLAGGACLGHVARGVRLREREARDYRLAHAPTPPDEPSTAAPGVIEALPVPRQAPA